MEVRARGGSRTLLKLHKAWLVPDGGIHLNAAVHRDAMEELTEHKEQVLGNLLLCERVVVLVLGAAKRRQSAKGRSSARSSDVLAHIVEDAAAEEAQEGNVGRIDLVEMGGERAEAARLSLRRQQALAHHKLHRKAEVMLDLRTHRNPQHRRQQARRM